MLIKLPGCSSFFFLNDKVFSLSTIQVHPYVVSIAHRPLFISMCDALKSCVNIFDVDLTHSGYQIIFRLHRVSHSSFSLPLSFSLTFIPSGLLVRPVLTLL